MEPWSDPQVIRNQYKTAAAYKDGLCERGLYRQNKINERMYAGDQWYGAQCGEERPLVRYNVIKRIGEYKMAMIGGGRTAVRFSAEGVPETPAIRRRAARRRETLRRQTGYPVSAREAGEFSPETVSLLTGALSDYYRVTARRVKLDACQNDALRKAYISGTGILYTYWDERIPTGLYADAGRTSPVFGDIRCEVLDVENVYFGEPNRDDVQEQPYIIIASRREVEDVRREAARFGGQPDDIRPDSDTDTMAGDRGEREPDGARRVTVLTKFYKHWDETGKTATVWAVKVTDGAMVRPAWDTRLRLYPVAKLSWEPRANCIYGDSEVTHLVPNQIAINRAITAGVWAVMAAGMPTMLVNGDIITQPVTNEPGQIIPVYGSAEDMASAIRYVAPPDVSPRFDTVVGSLITHTQQQAGAGETALGDVNPNNTSAILAVRETAALPLQVMQERFYAFLEDNARIWAEYWVTAYGKRALKIRDRDGEWYLPFDGDACRDLLLRATVEAAPTGLRSRTEERQTLDDLFAAGVLNRRQYLERLPKGTVEDLEGLLAEETPEAEEGAAE